ncbi:MAG: hypothetical protein EPO21_20930 [Chloroflexota bacterium]|nr:MAG: hypothetical protein EPO21_20930 [Chloroflexota bacterium]
MERELLPPEPVPAFARALRRRLASEAEELATARLERAQVGCPRPRLMTRLRSAYSTWSLAGLSAVAALALFVIGAYLLTLPAKRVSAEEIVERAAAVVNSPFAAGIRSFVVIEQVVVTRPAASEPRSTELAAGEQLRGEIKRSYADPTHWQVQATIATFDSAGNQLPGRSWKDTWAADGTDLWHYDSARNEVAVQHLDPRGSFESIGELSPFGQGAVTLSDVLENAGRLYTPKLQGEETIAGRATYVVDMGAPKRKSAALPELSGRRVLWIDKESFLVLKAVQYDGRDDAAVSTVQSTSFAYNVPIDPATFAFQAPQDAALRDLRPKPAPNTDQFRAQLAAAESQLGFQPLAPRDLPDGLAPRLPRIEAASGLLVLEYVPPDEVERDTIPTTSGIVIREQKADDALVATWTKGAEATEIPHAKGWLRRGVPGQTAATAYVLRDGMFVTIFSFRLTPEELLKVASSLEPQTAQPR